jgi:hypothetical protein
MIVHKAFFLLTLPLLGACAHNEPVLGEALRWDIAQQVIDPEPRHEGELLTDGKRAAEAVNRYKNGTVRQPARTDTTSSAGAGGPR